MLGKLYKFSPISSQIATPNTSGNAPAAAFDGQMAISSAVTPPSLCRNSDRAAGHRNPCVFKEFGLRERIVQKECKKPTRIPISWNVWVPRGKPRLAPEFARPPQVVLHGRGVNR